MAEVRTQQELSSASFNYFIALKLGAKETNTKVIEKAIAEIKSLTDDDAYGERLKKLTADMTEVLINDAVFDPSRNGYVPNSGARKRESDAAVKFKLAEMMELVKNICLNNGMIFKSELQALRNNANKEANYYSFPELEKEFLAFNASGAVKYVDDITGIKIPFKDFDRISESLTSSLKMTTLYEFLGVSPTASEQEISSAKQKAYNDYMAKGDRSFRTLGKTLCGDVETILLVKDARKQYDYYVKLRDKVWKQFALRRQFGAKSISLNEFYSFAQIVMDTLKLGLDEVQTMLGAGLKTYGLTVAGGDKEGTGAKELEICPYPDCGKIYEAGAKVCPHCGKALEVLCWNCNSRMPFTMKSKTCPTCGASYQNKDKFTVATGELDKLLALPVPDLTRVQQSLMALKNLVPDYRKAASGVIARKVAEYEKELERRAQIERTKGEAYREEMKAVNALVGGKNYLQAKSAAEQVRRKYPDYNLAETNKTIAELDAVIQKAQRELATARQLITQGNEDGAVSAVMRALDIVADYNEARQFIAKYPPKAPAALRVTVAGQNAKLEWQMPASRANTTYYVIRKVGSAPSNTEDGTAIARGLSIDFYEDKSVAAATRYFYGVYSERGGVKSNLTVCPTPVQFFTDVSNIRQELVEDKISVKWDAPNNVKTIEVWKKRGVVAPQQAGEGQRVQADLNGFTDTDAGEISYLIICRYDAGGTLYSSKGIQRTFKRYEILKKPEQVEIAQLTNTEFSFKAKASGKPRLLFANEKLACRTDVVQEAALYTEAVKGARELRINYAGEEMSFALPVDAVGYVYPVFYNDQLFIVSPPTLVNTVCPVRDLRYAERGNAGMLTGTLHPSLTAVIAKISERGFVKSFDEPADTMRLSAEEFRSKGGMSLNLKRNVEYYITVFGEAELGGKKLMTSAVSLDEAICQRDRVPLLYCFKYTASPTKDFKVTIEFSAESEAEVPDLLLMRGYPRPLDKTKGELVEKIPRFTLKKGMFSKSYTYKTTITAKGMSNAVKFVLFPATEGSYVQLREVNKL